MKKLLRHIQFLFDYYVGYSLTNANKLDMWSENIVNKYPEKFKNNNK
jgi:hypothetical protein